MAEPRPRPARGEVDPLFDGHLERPLTGLTVAERLDWIWEAMQLLRLGADARERARGSPAALDRSRRQARRSD